jgi:hypothetical protein
MLSGPHSDSNAHVAGQFGPIALQISNLTMNQDISHIVPYAAPTRCDRRFQMLIAKLVIKELCTARSNHVNKRENAGDKQCNRCMVQ